MSITITHSAAEGTLLDGTTRQDARRGGDVRKVLDRFMWKWMPSIGMWGQRSSRGQLPRYHRINGTRDALEGLGYTVEVQIDTTPRDQAEADADKANQLEARADALDAKAERRTTEGAARADRSREFFRDLQGQPIQPPGHHSRNADINRREKHAKNWDKGLTLMREGEQTAKRADTARASRDRLDSPHKVYRRIQRLETELRRLDRELAGRKQWMREPDGRDVWRHGAPTGEHRERLLAQREHVANELAHRRAQHEHHRAQGWFTMFGPDELRKGDQVKVGFSWQTIVRVNQQSITVTTGYSWTNRIPYDEVQHVRRDGQEVPMPTGATDRQQ